MKRQDLAPASRIVISQVVRNIEVYFGQTALADVTAGSADDFIVWMKTKARSPKRVNESSRGLSLATVGKRLQWCRTICESARRHKLIVENPFAELKGFRDSNIERQAYVPAEHIERIIEMVPQPEWKLLFAMSRYLGVRVPSEVFTLTWDGVDWERSRMKINSPKTAKCGKPWRWAPILPQVRPHLDLVFEQATDGATHLFAELRQRKSTASGDSGHWMAVNLRTRFLKLIERAGFQPWPRLFHSLRASAQTDLSRYCPQKAVCDWLGNTEAIAMQHYLQTTDQDFDRAASGEWLSEPARQGAVKCAARHAQMGPIGTEPENGNEETPGFPGVSFVHLEGRGIEPSPVSKQKTASSPASVVKSVERPPSALNGNCPELARLLAVWPALADADRLALADHAETLANGRQAAQVGASSRRSAKARQATGTPN